jgi:PAP2 superfamily
MATTQDDAAAPPRLRWWKEAVFALLFYAMYSFARNLFGSARIDIEAGELPEQAFRNATRVIGMEKALGLYHELAVQQLFVPASGLAELWIRFWNVYYGTFHFVVTLAAFVWLFVRMPRRFARWRNTLAFATLLAIIGFSLFPLMPPRLLDKPAIEWGGAELAEAQGRPPSGFVDTLERYGGLWSFDSGAMKDISNQYAAMPSLHIGWSVWCALAMWPLVRRRWAKALLVLYPIATLFCIVVTANHFWLDGVGGLAALGGGYLLARALEAVQARRRARQAASVTPVATGA